MKELKLTWMERKACLVMSYLKYNEDGFYKCLVNNLILYIARALLGWRDPIDFACMIVGKDEHDEDAGCLANLR